MNQPTQVYSSLLWLVLVSVMMFFMVIRPQQKQQRSRVEMLKNIKTGDKIVSVGGLVGVITQIRDDAISLKIADRVEIELLKSGIAYIKDARS